MKKTIAVIISLAVASVIAGQAFPSRTFMVMAVDPNGPRVTWEPATAAEIDQFYAEQIAPRVAAQVQQIIGTVPPAGVTAAAMNDAIGVAKTQAVQQAWQDTKAMLDAREGYWRTLFLNALQPQDPNSGV